MAKTRELFTLRFLTRTRRAGAPAKRGIEAAALAALLVISIPRFSLAAPPATQPSDDTDWLMSTAKPAPATRPDEDADHIPTAPQQSPLVDTQQHDDSRAGALTLSDGRLVPGKFTHTADKPLRIWVDAEQKYEDVAFDQIKSIDAIVVWELEEREWHFKESGSDIKEYSGKTYPARETNFTVTLGSGKTVTGAMDEPIYQITPDGQTLFTINKRDKGPVGQSLAQLVYIKHAEFESPVVALVGRHHHHSSEPMTPPGQASAAPDDDAGDPGSPSVPGGATPARPSRDDPPATRPNPLFDTK